jgi:hypothetical protein
MRWNKMIKFEFTGVPKPRERTYPCLGYYTNGQVILFTGLKTGMVVVPPTTHGYGVGYFSVTWDDNWTELPTGQIVSLSNQ